MSEVEERIVDPTPERFARGRVERLDRIIDDDGRAASPHRAIDILSALERRGAITAEMRMAGEDFRSCFHTAWLDPIKAADVSRPVVSGRVITAPGARMLDARESVWNAVLAVGGVASPGGSCLWHVIGRDMTLQDWAKLQGWCGRRVSRDQATGILISALGTLAKHFDKAA